MSRLLICLIVAFAAFGSVGRADSIGSEYVCCAGPPPEFSAQFVAALQGLPEDQALDAQAMWIQRQLGEAELDQLIAVQAAIAGYCVRECSQSFATARVVVDALVEDQKNSAEALAAQQQQQAEEKMRRDDRMMSIISAVVGAIVATLGIVLVNLVQARRHSRGER